MTHPRAIPFATFGLTFVGSAVLLMMTYHWWILVVVAFVAGLWLGRTAWSTFWQAFWAVALLWGSYVCYLHLRTEGILTGRIAALFSLPIPELMIAVAAVVGGVAAGLGALSGYYLRMTFTNKRPPSVYQPT
ncbi:hypothetical protein SAMN05421823_102635 [Catalinimonas alkaloidigena]|uniref:Transmembrane protein n=1 Tax=Catalinimonas alkaloidigena TaxID=1075417 RepID=A0A1G9BLC2_9BACT|nr:hypothetical protein [Catalinimonas alkaloidigena]SDK39665.1 hypothetical protein SAMN05421823_102635 [Catalinimonas alkaloidigena]